LNAIDPFGTRTRVLTRRARTVTFVRPGDAPTDLLADDAVLRETALELRWLRWDRIPMSVEPEFGVDPGENRDRALRRWAEQLPFPITMRGALGRFINLWGIGSESELAVNAATFARVYGTLDLCPHLLPSGHCFLDIDRLAGWAPVSAFGFFANVFRDLVLAGQDALVHPRKGFRFESDEYAAAQLVVLHWTPERLSPPRTLRGLVSEALTALEMWSHTRRTVHWGPYEEPEFHPVAYSPLVSALVDDVVASLRGPRPFVACHGCGYLVDMRERPRMTIKGRKTWCDRCRERGRHKRESEREKRAERAQSRGDDADGGVRGGATRRSRS
jgi:hypothetical protein